MTPAGRPREFDVDVALDAAMEAFWLNGFGGTSMSDLERATGLGKGSLYNAFGDKHALFVKALQRYMQKQMAPVVTMIMSATTATEGVRRFVEFAQTRGVCESGAKMGCMAVNTINELAQDDPVVREILHASMNGMVEVLSVLVRRGQESGEFRSDVDAESLAEYLGTINAGFSLHGKGEFPRVGTADLVDIALSALAPR